MTDHRHLQELLRSEDGDPGCDAAIENLDVYIDRELTGENPAATYPGTAIHLQACPACRTDHDGLLESARRFGDATPR